MAQLTKWRPTLTMIILLMMGAVLLLPVAGIGFFRLFENHLVKSTESELIAQSAAIAAVMAQKLREADTAVPLGSQIEADPAVAKDKRWNPIVAQIDLSSAPILGERGAARSAATPINPDYEAIGAALSPILLETQKSTLAGFRLLDFNGTVIAGTRDVGGSFAHLPEIEQALAGRYASVLRKRIIEDPQPISSISRGTAVRIMSAFPVVVDNRVAGVVYASRTPSNIIKELYYQRTQLIFALGTILLIALIIGLVFARTISSPIRELTQRTERIGKGDHEAIKALNRYGSREVHQLSVGFLYMARKLVDRSEYINTFATHVTHEMKSPLTAIQGAVELLALGGKDISEADRARFLENIQSDTARMTLLLNRLRALARVENMTIAGSCDLHQVLEPLEKKYRQVKIHAGKPVHLPIAREAADIILANLIENAASHGATTVSIQIIRSADTLSLIIGDNGSGISASNREHIFDLFFTTRREQGGTGLGLGIVRSLLSAHGGTIECLTVPQGAAFRIDLKTMVTDYTNAF